MKTSHRPTRLCGYLACLLAISIAPQAARADNADLAGIHVPEGFVIERVAGPPLIERPIMAGFDERGRLFVADSSGINLNDKDLLKDPPHKIRLLEDTDNDGKFDKSTVFADKMVFPQGALWYDGALYVCSPPSLWKLEDTDGDGVADKRTEIVKGFGFTGNAADIHGPFLGPDGWLYWCDGRHGHDIHQSDGTTLVGKAAGIFRCKPDGSRVEKVCGGGMDNPVEIAFTAAGEPIVSCNIFERSPKRVDVLFYGIDGGVFPWNDVFSEFKQTGELLPPITDLGWVAVSGLTRYRGSAFGPQYKDNFFTAQFNPHRVQRHVLERDGAHFRAKNEDFLTCDNTDFHPTDVLEDADGSLLVIDTGGWFRQGCPASQIAKPQITGGIYRISQRDAPKIDDPRGLKLKWDKVSMERLADPRPAVVDRAFDEWVSRRDDCVEGLLSVAQSWKEPAATHATWALARIDTDASRGALRWLLGAPPNRAVAAVAARGLGLSRTDCGMYELTLTVTQGGPEAREAALSLGRIGKAQAVASLLCGLKADNDRFLEHAIVYALIQIHDVPGTRKGLSDNDAAVRRGVLLALDQMDGGDLTAQEVIPLFNPAQPQLRQAAAWVISHHPDWAGAMLESFKAQFARGIDQKQADGLKQQLVSFSRDAKVQKLVADVLRNEKTPAATRLMLLETITESPLDRLPTIWADELARALTASDEAVVRQALIAIRSGPQGPPPALQRIEPQVDLPEGKGFVAGTKLNTNFTVRWSGVLRVAKNETYAISVQSKGPCMKRIGGLQPVAIGVNHAPEMIALSAGDHELRLDYAQGGGPHGCKLLWAVGGEEAKPIPPEALWHREPGKTELSPGLVARYYAIGPEQQRVPYLDVSDFEFPLLMLARNGSRAADLRAAAFAVIAPHVHPDSPALNFLLDCLGRDRPSLLRTTAADALGRMILRDPDLLSLTSSLATAGPMEAPKLLPVFERSADPAVGGKLVDALGKSPGLRSIRPQALEQVLGHYPSEIRKQAEPLLQQITADAQKQKARLAELQPVLSGGDATRGRELFFGNKANCAACHAVGNTGGRVGPDFTHIGAIRSGIDLLESIVYPSNSFVRGFEPYLIKTKDGDILDGIITRETADAVYLYNSQKIETRLARSGIQEIKLSTVSIMPEGFDTQLAKQELADLIAFLQSLK